MRLDNKLNLLTIFRQKIELACGTSNVAIKHRFMKRDQLSDEFKMVEQAEEQGKLALRLGLIPSFAVYYFPNRCQFYIPNENESAPLNPEEAYRQLRKLILLSAL